MFDWLRRLIPKRAVPSASSEHREANSSAPWANMSTSPFLFNTHGWLSHGVVSDGVLRWETAEGDQITLHFFNLPPDLPTCETVGDLRLFYERLIEGTTSKLVECLVVDVAGHPSVLITMKVPQKPTGMTYQIACTLPFRDFSFVVKARCEERGRTGVRETELFSLRMSRGETPSLDEGKPFFQDWNPDSADYDAKFPTHPVSRARRLMSRIIKTAKLEESIRSRPGFRLPKD